MRAHIKIFMLAMILLASSCGIFKKSTKTTHKSSTTSSLDSTETTTIKEKADYVGVLDESTMTLILLKGDQIRINKDGSIDATGSASAEQTKIRDSKSRLSGSVQRDTHTESKKSMDVKESVKHTEKVSEPDQKISGKIIGYIVLLIGAILIYFIVIKGK